MGEHDSTPLIFQVKTSQHLEMFMRSAEDRWRASSHGATTTTKRSISAKPVSLWGESKDLNMDAAAKPGPFTHTF